MEKEKGECLNKLVVVQYSGGEIRGTCKAVDVYLNVAIETEDSIHIIKGSQIQNITEAM
ncbi:hypothetical protein NEMIN01_2049 [Nematocida minor]|uniref:uncharacterized protein n=1 Tax=Nematocida minor TaxID=1912983 RepID=UPI00221FE884|nr:uncharacterized protein NEMIN01_2049 [Nematocida minor]KAI5192498.1 hypothetical protein NEMIN01_2049 [Nematocida minor]